MQRRIVVRRGRHSGTQQDMEIDVVNEFLRNEHVASGDISEGDRAVESSAGRAGAPVE